MAYLFDDNEEYVTIFTDKGTGKRTKLLEFEKTSRAKRGILLMKVIKSNPSKIVNVYIANNKNVVGIISDNYSKLVKISEVSIMDRYSNGSYVIKDRINNSYMVTDLVSEDEEVSTTNGSSDVNKDISLKEIDDELSKVDSIINDTME